MPAVAPYSRDALSRSLSGSVDVYPWLFQPFRYVAHTPLFARMIPMSVLQITYMAVYPSVLILSVPIPNLTLCERNF